MTSLRLLRQTYPVLPTSGFTTSKYLLTAAHRLRCPSIGSTGAIPLCRRKRLPVASFHNSAPRAILPALPQVIKGTVNDPVSVPDPAAAHGRYHWSFERIISAALIPLTIAPFAAGSLNPLMDATLCSLLLVHSHIGFESIIIDYVPERRVPVWRLAFIWGLRAGTLLVAVGLYEFETNDVGVTEAIKRIWHA